MSSERMPPRPDARAGVDLIELDSRDSFPASDAPGWTSVTRVGDPLPSPEKTTRKRRTK